LPTPRKSDAQKRIAAAEYIAVEASRLARMANANQFPLLSYLIDMAVLEAWREASESGNEQDQSQDEGGKATSPA
jgi:hypothetical protein